MTQVDRINFRNTEAKTVKKAPRLPEFEKEKLSKYDIARIEKMAIEAAFGDSNEAKATFDELVIDKKLDKLRNIGVSATLIATSIVARRGIAAKMTKGLAKGGDIACDLFRKYSDDGRKIVSDFLSKEINSEDAIRKGVGKIIKNQEYLNKATERIQRLFNKIKLGNIGDVATVGVAAGIGATIDNPINRVLDRADEAMDSSKRNWKA